MLPKANLKSRLALPNVSHPTPKREPPQVLNVTCSLKHEQAFIKRDMLPQGHKVSNVTSPFAHLSFPNVTSCQANQTHSILPASPSRAPCFDSVQTWAGHDSDNMLHFSTEKGQPIPLLAFILIISSSINKGASSRLGVGHF
ncbi:hypothetical protein PIB30_084844, partial [Stylosanthes scabra]|nr:hypothetical protein [Stylosanthes scabra]